MKKQLFFAALALTALAGCSDDSFVGDQSPQKPIGAGVISFDMGTPAVTRSTSTEVTALNSNFVVFGYKNMPSPATTPQVVFNNYQVNYVTGKANTTVSNTAGWEYVSYKNLPNGVGTNAGVTAFAATTTGDPNNSAGIEQSIKYWDFSASSYDFFAYSLGAGNSSSWAKASAMSTSPNTYYLEGTAAQLGTCYISNKQNVVPSVSETQVNLEFRSFLSQIELKFYETIPGYSVKSLSFYPSSTGASGAIPYLYASSSVLPTGGKYTVTFDDDGNAQLSFDTSAGSKTYGSNIAFSSTLKNYGGVDYKEASDSYLGRASNDATSTDPISVLPNPQNNQALHLMMDFTLVSRDGSGETINMKGATAVIPAAYAMWKPNYKYTYIFKISDNTNAKTAAITGLYPITLDATVTNAVDGSQETITTVDDPSITTYAKGTMVTTNNEYKTGANIYIVVNDGTALTVSGEHINAKLYTAAITLETGGSPRPAAQGITEETVANALAQGGSVVDANGATLAVTAAAGLTADTKILATDAPDGHQIDVNVAKFTPAAKGDYVFEYTVAAVNYTAEEAATYNAGLTGAIASGATLTAEQAGLVNSALLLSGGDAYATDGTAVISLDHSIAYNATLTGAKSTTDVKTPAAKHYKVIKVVAA